MKGYRGLVTLFAGWERHLPVLDVLVRPFLQCFLLLGGVLFGDDILLGDLFAGFLLVSNLLGLLFVFFVFILRNIFPFIVFQLDNLVIVVLVYLFCPACENALPPPSLWPSHDVCGASSLDHHL